VNDFSPRTVAAIDSVARCAVSIDLVSWPSLAAASNAFAKLARQSDASVSNSYTTPAASSENAASRTRRIASSDAALAASGR